MERGDYQATVRHWEKLKKMIPPDDENAKIVENGILHARSLMAQKGQKMPAASSQFASSAEQTQAGGKEAITGNVALSDALKGQASPNDTLFVLVRAAQGPKMPLAIIRKQVKDLPLKFTLDDSTAMTPEMKLSNFDQVVVIARVSKSGNAMTQSGDLQVMSAPIKPGAKGLKLVIDTVAP
jgi:cytochrome c-type biogenesis protein CcmH